MAVDAPQPALSPPTPNPLRPSSHQAWEHTAVPGVGEDKAQDPAPEVRGSAAGPSGWPGQRPVDRHRTAEVCVPRPQAVMGGNSHDLGPPPASLSLPHPSNTPHMHPWPTCAQASVFAGLAVPWGRGWGEWHLAEDSRVLSLWTSWGIQQSNQLSRRV